MYAHINMCFIDHLIFGIHIFTLDIEHESYWPQVVEVFFLFERKIKNKETSSIHELLADLFMSSTLNNYLVIDVNSA